MCSSWTDFIDAFTRTTTMFDLIPDSDALVIPDPSCTWLLARLMSISRDPATSCA
ncbi:hypothetical protein JCM19237_304 [Photobacterium aphoticum]|uniref:Uncharacterized protein n=1 Tax=Photobacterium aphoticum TaxID=754436 RepID=A0A090R1D9_9GAMM|nr:hypothetical protein JCM19237_304 [Photobacterium aphoticum]